MIVCGMLGVIMSCVKLTCSKPVAIVNQLPSTFSLYAIHVVHVLHVVLHVVVWNTV